MAEKIARRLFSPERALVYLDRVVEFVSLVE
jgi:hypothetical protein